MFEPRCSWMLARERVCQGIPPQIQRQGQRRSGPRGTSALNWLTNFVCWCCVFLGCRRVRFFHLSDANLKLVDEASRRWLRCKPLLAFYLIIRARSHKVTWLALLTCAIACQTEARQRPLVLQNEKEDVKSRYFDVGFVFNDSCFGSFTP